MAKSKMMHIFWGSKTKDALFEIFLLGVTAIFLYPLFMVILVSLKSPLEAIVSPNTLPKEIHWYNYVEAWKVMKYPIVFLNSAIISSLSITGLITFAGLAAFIIAKTKSRKYQVLYILFMSGFMIPFHTSLVPIVKLMSILQLNNSLLGAALYYIGRGMPMAVFLYVGFVKQVPNEVIESAVMDGTGQWVLYWRIVFPMLKSITTTIVILNFLWIWNDFLLPLLVLSSSKLHTIPLAQYAFYGGDSGSRWELAFSAYVLGIIPVIILYIFLQKNITKGISAGAVKG